MPLAEVQKWVWQDHTAFRRSAIHRVTMITCGGCTEERLQGGLVDVPILAGDAHGPNVDPWPEVMLRQVPQEATDDWHAAVDRAITDDADWIERHRLAPPCVKIVNPGRAFAAVAAAWQVGGRLVSTVRRGASSPRRGDASLIAGLHPTCGRYSRRRRQTWTVPTGCGFLGADHIPVRHGCCCSIMVAGARFSFAWQVQVIARITGPQGARWPQIRGVA